MKIPTRKHIFVVLAAFVAVLLVCLWLMSPDEGGTSHVMPERMDNPDVRKMRYARDEYGRNIDEIDYYLRSHSLMDEGYDIVTRRREHLVRQVDSLSTLIDVTCRMEYTVPFFVMTQSEYIYNTEKNILTSPPLVGGRVRLSPDTLWQCDNGVAMVSYPDGSYYEGQYVDTLYEGSSSPKHIRHGFGVSFSASYVRAGLWDNDAYRGEQPTYTANHIYGIDISRYQHEQPGAKVKPAKKGRRGAVTYRTVKQKVKVKGKWRTVTKKVAVAKPASYPIDWNRLRITSLGTRSKKKIDGTVDYPISFVYIKATEGISILNKYYLGDYVQSRKHGYKTGSYHFFSTKTSAQSQAMYFIQHSRYQKGDLPPVLDVEPSPAQVSAMGGANVLLSRVRKWMELIEKYQGVRPVLYVSHTFVNRYLNSRYHDGEYIKKNYHVWIARYGEYKPDVHLLFWQLCPDGRVAGIRFPVDINIFNGYSDSFNEFVK